MGRLEDSAVFSTFAGLDSRLLPFLFAKFGNPVRGIIAYVQRVTAATKLPDFEKPDIGKEKVDKEGPETFIAKLDRLREQSPEDYAVFRMHDAPQANVAAGSDTTSISLTSTMYNIIKKPRIYQKLRDELVQATMQGKADDPITFDQAQALPYLQMVIKEALRMHAATGLPMWRVVQIGGATIADTFFPEGVSDLSCRLQIGDHQPLIFQIVHCRYQHMGCSLQSRRLHKPFHVLS